MEYEERILKQRCENREILKNLGILNNNPDSNRGVKATKCWRTLKPIPTALSLKPTRRSSRLQGKKPFEYDVEALEQVEKDDIERNKFSRRIKRENQFGSIPGIVVGAEYQTRLEASAAGVHRPTVAGIHGNPKFGCYSLALSGGYEDDVDAGYSFIYTGEGGRDLKGTKANPKNLRTGPQAKDQVLERGNLALSKNIENNVPVRVIRGYKLNSSFAPENGYRYDGLYNVVNYFTTTGASGFKIIKFKLERVKDQEPAPWMVKLKEPTVCPDTFEKDENKDVPHEKE